MSPEPPPNSNSGRDIPADNACRFFEHRRKVAGRRSRIKFREICPATLRANKRM